MGTDTVDECKSIPQSFASRTIMMLDERSENRTKEVETVGAVVFRTGTSMIVYRQRPRRPPFLRVVSVGIGVTSSMRPILVPPYTAAFVALCSTANFSEVPHVYA